MEKTVKWFRVTDPLSPLFGCDVQTWSVGLHDWPLVVALRRVDIFVGDRPFQLVAKSGEDLGLQINPDILTESPMQDDIVELGTDMPYGKVLVELEKTRADGLTLNFVTYERAGQVSIISTGKVAAKKTYFGFDTSRSSEIELAFDDGDNIEDLKYMIERD